MEQLLQKWAEPKKRILSKVGGFYLSLKMIP